MVFCILNNQTECLKSKVFTRWSKFSLPSIEILARNQMLGIISRMSQKEKNSKVEQPLDVLNREISTYQIKWGKCFN